MSHVFVNGIKYSNSTGHEEEKEGAWHVNGKFRPLRELEIDN